MASEPILIDANPSTFPSRLNQSAALRSAVTYFWALTKPEVNSLIVIATFTGFCMAYGSRSGAFPFSLLVHTMAGTLLVASGAGTLNQYLERRFDVLMRRTGRRPLAAGRLQPSVVLWFGVVLSTVGCIYLAIAANLLASLLATVTVLSYLFVYTPLKRRTPFCTLIGAIPGAAPPLIGWAALSGTLSLQAWILYAVLFLWQFPHFMAIAWMYRDDYDRAGYLVLPQGRARASFVALQTTLPLVALFPVSLLVAAFGPTSVVYCIGSLLLSLGFLYYGTHFVLRGSRSAARRLRLASLIYLPSLLVLITVFRN
jgi:protoheme IX farnesyltransferase